MQIRKSWDDGAVSSFLDGNQLFDKRLQNLSISAQFGLVCFNTHVFVDLIAFWLRYLPSLWSRQLLEAHLEQELLGGFAASDKLQQDRQPRASEVSSN